jgi:hypothetical protein
MGVGHYAIARKYHLIHAGDYWIKALSGGRKNIYLAITFTPLSAYAYIFFRSSSK